MGGAAGDLWVFGYGSLMWRPDFPFAEALPARLDGWHRRFCIVSRHYRGTDERPGLVLGLDRGGVCEGRAFRVSSDDAMVVRAYLRRREQISGVYREAHLPVTLHTPARERLMALVFLAEPAHPSFIRPLGLKFQADIIRGATGKTGTNVEYLVSTLEALRAFGIRDCELERLMVTLGPVMSRAGRTGRVRSGDRKSMAAWPPRPVLRLADVKRFTHRARLGNPH